MAFLVTSSALLVIAALAFAILSKREAAKREVLKVPMEAAVSEGAVARKYRVDFSSLENLPPPVRRYFTKVLTDGKPLIESAYLEQRGTLRTGPASNRWMTFSATQRIVPPTRSFFWNARISLPLGLHIRVIDSLSKGKGAGRVSLLSAFPIAAESDVMELNSASLHRYLAEAVWCPTALLPESGVAWKAIDDHSAMAFLNEGKMQVSLVFRFNEEGEVEGVYSPERFEKVGKSYRKAAWEGRFSKYVQRAGMHVPLHGEVGWYRHDSLELVWKGEIAHLHYEFSVDGGNT